MPTDEDSARSKPMRMAHLLRSQAEPITDDDPVQPATLWANVVGRGSFLDAKNICADGSCCFQDETLDLCFSARGDSAANVDQASGFQMVISGTADITASGRASAASREPDSSPGAVFGGAMPHPGDDDVIGVPRVRSRPQGEQSSSCCSGSDPSPSPRTSFKFEASRDCSL
jgi:hypothetical protein